IGAICVNLRLIVFCIREFPASNNLNHAIRRKTFMRLRCEISKLRRLLYLSTIFVVFASSVVLYAQQKSSSPKLLSYSDLVQLYEVDQPAPELESRLTQLLNTPFVSNTASARRLKT